VTSSFAPNRSRLPYLLAFALLLGLHFYVRPLVFESPAAPDFLLVAALFYAMQTGPGAGALAGFAVGLVQDALVPAHFGAAMLAHALVGALAAWGRAVFFAENAIVTAGFMAAGVIIRDLIMLLAGGGAGGAPGGFLGGTLPQAVTTGVAAAFVTVLFRRWFAVRLDQ